jgi:hypothetical protein
MGNLWERFENIVSKDEVQVEKHKFEPLAIGEYKVKLEVLEPSESKNGLPMLKGQFRMSDSNRIIFYNQMLQNLNSPQMTAVNIAEAIAFVGGLVGESLEFEGMGEFANLVENVPLGNEYRLMVTYGNKDFDQKFPKLKVLEKIETEELSPLTDVDLAF